AALKSLADEDALAFFTCAQRAAALARTATDAGFEEDVGDVCSRTGRPDEAREHFGRSLAAARSPLDRGRVRAKLAGLSTANRDLQGAWRQIDSGFSEIRSSMPTLSPVSVAGSLAQGLLASLLGKRRAAPLPQ